MFHVAPINHTDICIGGGCSKKEHILYSGPYTGKVKSISPIGYWGLMRGWKWTVKLVMEKQAVEICRKKKITK